MLARNTAVSFVVFGFDLALLWLLVELGGMDKVLAVTLAFIVANVLHYALARVWIFRGTDRAVASGLVYFMVNAVIGLGVTVAAFWLLTNLTPLHYLVARILASVVSGLTTFALNALLNFRSL